MGFRSRRQHWSDFLRCLKRRLKIFASVHFEPDCRISIDTNHDYLDLAEHTDRLSMAETGKCLMVRNDAKIDYDDGPSQTHRLIGGLNQRAFKSRKPTD